MKKIKDIYQDLEKEIEDLRDVEPNPRKKASKLKQNTLRQTLKIKTMGLMDFLNIEDYLNKVVLPITKRDKKETIQTRLI